MASITTMHASTSRLCITATLLVWVLCACTAPPNSTVRCEDSSTCLTICQNDPAVCAAELNKFVLANYQTWSIFPGKRAAQANIRTPMHGAYVSIYVNPLAAEYAKTLSANTSIETVQFPSGSIIVKQNATHPNMDPDADPWLTVMIKQEGYCGSLVANNCSGGDWFYYLYRSGAFKSAEIVVAGKPQTQCIDCHAPAQKGDYLWSAFDAVAKHQQSRPQPTTTMQPRTIDACELASINATVPPDVGVDPNQSNQAQRLFDCFSWRSFIALNLPNQIVEPGTPWRGVPRSGAQITAPGPRVWETYPTVFDTFQPLDKTWTLSDRTWEDAVSDTGFCASSDIDPPHRVKEIRMTSKTRTSSRPTLADETHEAFGNPLNTLVDQNGKLTLFEVRINQDEWTFIRDTQYANTGSYGPGGPLQALNWTAEPLQMPDNTNGATGTGAIEIKAAWRQLCTIGTSCAKVDNPDRFYTVTANYYERPAGECRQVTLGLVGMHIAHKTHWAPQWVWSTFEHEDNVPSLTGTASNKSYNFYSAKTATKAPPKNVCINQRPGIFPAGHPLHSPSASACANLQSISNALPGASAVANQITRIDPISSTPLNESFPDMLKTLDSPFQHYRLVNTQWPKNGRGNDGQVNAIDCSEAKSGQPCYTVAPPAGQPGHRLRNTSMESYQVSYSNPNPNTSPPSNGGQYSSAGCMQCHSRGVDFSYVWTDAIEEPVPIR
ncbi:MAG: hypothetical protein ACI9B8_002035 [Sulfitobacter sp.]|jgi:hypothetical protein